ncbi:MAG: ATP-binding protein [Verrucomicrobiales bacterium]|nr:ATP-binding protein [Verrucomicrobiales bacterium]
MNIRAKFRTVSICVVLVLVATVWAVYQVAAEEVTRKIFNHMALVADLQQDRMENALERNFERLEQVSARRELQEDLVRFVEDSVEDSRDKVNVILRDARLAVGSTLEVAIVSEGGKVLGSSNLDNIDSNVEGETFFKSRPEDGRGVSFEKDEEGLLRVVLSEPIASEEDGVLGLIVIKSDGAGILTAMESEDGGNQSLETLLVQRGKDGEAEVLTPLKFEWKQPGMPLRNVVKGIERTYENAPDYRGEPVLAVTKYFPDLGLGFVVKIDRADAFRGLHRIRNYSLVALVVALVVLEVVFLAIGQSIVKPIQRVTETATKISEGDLSRRVEVVSSDEIGELARDFNKMTEALAELNAGLERKVDERTAELERSNGELKQFAYVASHDLKEPLRMVASYLQLLERRCGEAVGDEGKEFIGFAVDGAKRMQGLIDALLEYSRVGTKTKVLEQVELVEVFGTVKQNLKVAVEESGAVLTCGELPAVEGDAVQLVQLVQNLAANAIKFCGDRVPEVHVSSEKSGGMLKVRVEDNGIGIKADHIERIFMIFQRLHTREEYEGTGIGLAVCKKIVERHGGTLWVESVEGEGSTFCFTLSGAPGVVGGETAGDGGVGATVAEA